MHQCGSLRKESPHLGNRRAGNADEGTVCGIKRCNRGAFVHEARLDGAQRRPDFGNCLRALRRMGQCCLKLPLCPDEKRAVAPVLLQRGVKRITCGPWPECPQGTEDNGCAPAPAIPESFIRPPLLKQELDEFVIGRCLMLPEECLHALFRQIIGISSRQGRRPPARSTA